MKSQTPEALVGDWRYVGTSADGGEGYFTIQPDGKYVLFLDASRDEDLKKSYKSSWLAVRHRLVFEDDGVVIFKSRSSVAGVRHLHRFEDGALILERPEPEGRWVCHRLETGELPEKVEAEKKRMLGKEWW